MSVLIFYKPLKTRIRLILTKMLGKDFVYLQRNSSDLENVDVISFDVFDTLILRTIPLPSDVFNFLNPEDKTFKGRRIEAERNARKHAHEQGREDITLWEIYKVLKPNASYSELEKYVQAEINTELRVCRVNPDALEFFKDIQSGKYGKKRVVITSDMYLNRDVISTILMTNGFNLEGVDVFVSSEYGMTKKSGSLFRKVLELEKVENPEKLLHIGDNLISDYIKPRKCGMKSFLYSARFS